MSLSTGHGTTLTEEAEAPHLPPCVTDTTLMREGADECVTDETWSLPCQRVLTVSAPRGRGDCRPPPPHECKSDLNTAQIEQGGL